MIKSMTGYGRAEIQSEQISGYVEIRAKNHRYKDVKVSLPRNLLSFEIPLLKLVNTKILRGKVDVLVQIDSYLNAGGVTLSLNQELLSEYKRIFDELNSELGDAGGGIDIARVSQIKDLVVASGSDDNIDDYFSGIEEAVLAALLALDEMREREGEKLSEAISGFMSSIKAESGNVAQKRAKLIDGYHKKVKEKITRIIDESNLDENRVYQEIAYIIDKSDISEELDRLKSHTGQFDTIIKESGSIGKKLDFLFQEINREINTIGSKASDFDIATHVVFMKNELDRAREQAQNIE